jgi:hypothetical protein
VKGEPVYTEARAAFDDERIYRYLLTRAWKGVEFSQGTRTCKPGDRVLWIMLNPSTADETKLDPTLRRCLGFAHRWGFDGFEICNLYALRSTDPKGLWSVADPVGPNNDAVIQAAAKRAALVVVGWGGNAKLDRERAVTQLLADVGVRPYCLGTTDKGAPRHPLYLRADSMLFPWEVEP